MNKVLLTLSICLLFACLGCRDNDDDPIKDANGNYDMTETEVFTMLGAIGAGCQDELAASGEEVDSEAECLSSCKCSADAIAKLEGKTSASTLEEECKNSCSPNFVDKPDLDEQADDLDNLPDYEKFFVAYTRMCDTVSHDLVYSNGDFASECINTCNCLSDSIETYVSETADDNVRSQCSTQCNAQAAAKSLDVKKLLKVFTSGAVTGL